MKIFSSFLKRSWYFKWLWKVTDIFHFFEKSNIFCSSLKSPGYFPVLWRILGIFLLLVKVKIFYSFLKGPIYSSVLWKGLQFLSPLKKSTHLSAIWKGPDIYQFFAKFWIWPDHLKTSGFVQFHLHLLLWLAIKATDLFFVHNE